MSTSPTTLMPDVLPRVPAAGTWTGRLAHWVAESRSHRVICLVLGIWVLNGFDLAFTVLSHEQGVLHEENPVAAHLLGYGTTSIVLFKVGLVLIGSYPLLRFRTVRITEMAATLILFAYVLLAIRWSICYDLYSTTMTQGVNFAELANVNPAGP